MRIAFLCAALLCAAPATAAPMGAAEFERYTQGKTLHFIESGVLYGAERYFEGRKVEWSFLDGRCKSGEWYPQDGYICFTYEDRGTPQCWEFEREGRGLIATFKGQGQALELYSAEPSPEHLYCMGPDTGV